MLNYNSKEKRKFIFSTLKVLFRPTYFQYAVNMFPLFFAILKFCSTKHLFNYFKLITTAIYILFENIRKSACIISSLAQLKTYLCRIFIQRSTPEKNQKNFGTDVVYDGKIQHM